MNQEMNQVLEQKERRVFFVFKRSNHVTPTADDTPKYYARGPPSTLLVRQPRAVAIIVPRDLNFELQNE
jgi:hypothetical protein